MALINCPECSKEVSDKAPSCPNCGNPISTANDTQAIGTSLTTIQETSKRLKMHTIGSVLLVIVGVVWGIGEFGAVESGSEPSGISILIFLAGMIWYAVTRFRIWWHHK